ncbi:SprT-like domain-containing protein [Myceligenerans pegani]|uniref:SprT-like domain-containing protein n=1 Tax=Myceligenerans pegani TaxID=2776917 RepID=A0ABR9N4X4_9MICO|nr:SprT-like domain-containing protein [Myceligenerans sp. TRM 65318]MBE1878715.1 SprT-like domain-containing protein [Myceligenerans sp. TRM 65318]MBE3020986.1 SprT-like domain-containing protein [Myceligenerans sp. TRM 65318]
MNLVEARNLARDLMDQHGLVDWKFEYDDAKRRAGMCHFARRRISISAPLAAVYDEAEVRDTVLHEIAHALAGREAGHGEKWRAKAREIGCSAMRYVDPSAPTLDGPWIGVCPGGHRMTRFRRPGAPVSCRRCGDGAKTFQPLHLIAWTYRGHDAAMGERYERELRDLCVQFGVPVSVEPGTEERIVRAASGRRPLVVEPLDLSTLDLDEPASEVPVTDRWRSPVSRR